jgi:hypothetical protein
MPHPSWIGSAVLAVLIILSISLFWRSFGKVLAVIRHARPDADFHVEPLEPRIRQFVWEVLLQGKVIRERPLAGLAHAFVFWGFCAFALITLNHLATGFGFPVLSREGFFGPAYYYIVAIFAVAVAVSIAGLAIRRFIVRPLWLGPVSPESGLIAFLIFALMVTYLAGLPRLGFDESSTAGQINWWAHTLAVLLFLPLIPHTKHLHLVLSPVTVILKRQGFSAACRRRGFRPGHRQGRYPDRCATGLLLRGMRPLHRALPRL